MNQESQKKPKRWTQCPPFGELIDNTFLPFKTPYDGDDELPEAFKFTTESFIKQMKDLKIDIGLIINLTFSSRYYDPLVFTQDNKIEHHQIFCRGHNEAPQPKERAEFISICNQFIAKEPRKKIGVHCTHGFNRTGFMICSFLYEARDWSIDAAISVFASKRPPGVYKQGYINELFSNYGDADDPIMDAPLKPAWDDDDEFLEGVKAEEDAQKNGTNSFFEGITEVTLVKDVALREKIYCKCSKLVGFESRSHISFAGAQPVSLDRSNIKLLHLHRYRVSWKADGCRFMLYVQDENNIFFLARSLQLFKVSDGLKFPRIDNLREHITDTLFDGEMVLDEVGNEKIPRYLIYDVISLNGDSSIRMKNFDERSSIIRDIVVRARNKAKEQGLIPIDGEPFKIRDKGFYQLEATKKTIELKVAHEKDGLIFQPVDEPYQGGTCPSILKWKPPSLNSIDFKVSIREEKEKGCIPETFVMLHVSNKTDPMVKFKMTKEHSDFRTYNNKIVECVLTNTNCKNAWKIIRERTDKLHPNSEETARATFMSIRNPVTEQDLLNFIRKRPPEKTMINTSRTHV